MTAVRRARVLVVEDNASLRLGVTRALRERWSEVEELGDGGRARERLADRGVEPFDVVVTDLRLPGADGVDVLRAARARSSRTAVVLMTAYGSIDTAVEAMKLGAFDFVQKPFELETLELRVERAVAHAQLVTEVERLREERGRAPGSHLVGDSPSMHAAVELATRVAPSRSTVLLTGETGTGKELVAGLIHAGSPRAGRPFVKVNCAALPETLLESELFGHERGAFTGADRQRAGRFEQADGGTLFLDEIGDMTPATQVKLLRVLQDGEFHRVGGNKPLRCDVRIIAATNHDLEQRVREGGFREDLYFRLNVIRVHLPPLRERGGDAVALAVHFLEQFSRDLGRPGACFGEEALARIRAHAWPGNVRELRNAVERAVLLSDGDEIRAEHVGLAPSATPGWQPELPAGGLALEEVERAVVLEALRRARFVQKDAAALLRVSRRKLNYMIRRMGITHPSWRRNRNDAAPRAGTRGIR
ncbi:MAG TPA: sigma-54 dependent transcriptional regulator [Myxococcota bacterium]|nr:sigma-54 dependent transcriptional regulator [Myxococcota bacterium]